MGAENQVVDVEMYGFTLNTTLQLGAGDACWLNHRPVDWILDLWLMVMSVASKDMSGVRPTWCWNDYVTMCLWFKGQGEEESQTKMMHRDLVIFECVWIHATSSQN